MKTYKKNLTFGFNEVVENGVLSKFNTLQVKRLSLSQGYSKFFLFSLFPVANAAFYVAFSLPSFLGNSE